MGYAPRLAAMSQPSHLNLKIGQLFNRHFFALHYLPPPSPLVPSAAPASAFRVGCVLCLVQLLVGSMLPPCVGDAPHEPLQQGGEGTICSGSGVLGARLRGGGGGERTTDVSGMTYVVGVKGCSMQCTWLWWRQHAGSCCGTCF